MLFRSTIHGCSMLWSRYKSANRTCTATLGLAPHPVRPLASPRLPITSHGLSSDPFNLLFTVCISVCQANQGHGRCRPLPPRLYRLLPQGAATGGATAGGSRSSLQHCLGSGPARCSSFKLGPMAHLFCTWHNHVWPICWAICSNDIVTKKHCVQESIDVFKE